MTYVILPAGNTDDNEQVIPTTFFPWYQCNQLQQTTEEYDGDPNATVYTLAANGDGAFSGGWRANETTDKAIDITPILSGDYELVFSIKSTSTAKTSVKLVPDGREESANETEFTFTRDGNWQTVRMDVKEKFPKFAASNVTTGTVYLFSLVGGAGLKSGDSFTITNVKYVPKNTTTDPATDPTTQYTVKGAVINTTGDNQGFVWTSPIPEVTDNFAGLSGDYVGGGVTHFDDSVNPDNPDWSKAWAGEMNVTITNDSQGYISGTVQLVDFPYTNQPEFYLNNVKATETTFDQAAKTLTFKSKHTYVDERVTSWYIKVPYPDGLAQTRVFTYTIKNCTKKDQTYTIDNLAQTIFGWEHINYTRGSIAHYATDKELNESDPSDWIHTAVPVDGTKAGAGTYWNPDFNYFIASPITDSETGNVEFAVAIRFANGTIIPSNFNPRFELINSNGDVKYYTLKAVPDVINMFAYPDITTTASQAISRADAAENTVAAGNYNFNFHLEYLSVRNGNGYSKTVNRPVTLSAKEISTGISEVTENADAETPVEFYNLQGVRVANPAAGIYIRRHGTTVEKIMIR